MVGARLLIRCRFLRPRTTNAQSVYELRSSSRRFRYFKPETQKGVTKSTSTFRSAPTRKVLGKPNEGGRRATTFKGHRQKAGSHRFYGGIGATTMIFSIIMACSPKAFNRNSSKIFSLIPTRVVSASVHFGCGHDLMVTPAQCEKEGGPAWNHRRLPRRRIHPRPKSSSTVAAFRQRIRRQAKGFVELCKPSTDAKGAC